MNVLVEACEVDLDYLIGETGKSAEQVIKELSSLMSSTNDKDFEIISQQSNFQLIKPLEPRWLRLYQISVY